MELASSWTKLNRAEKLLGDLRDEIDAWVMGQPFEIKVVGDEPRQQAVIRVSRADPVPTGLSQLAGDAVHNLRSALDHAVWQLAGKRASRVTEFPLLIDRAKWRNAAQQQLAGVPDEAQVVIERHQPFHAREAEAAHLDVERFADNLMLLGIARLDNLDKHRLLLGRHPIIEIDPIRLVVDGRLSEGPPEVRQVRMEVGTEVARLSFRGFPSAVTLRNPSWLLIFGAEPPAGQFWTSDLAAMSAADMRIAAEGVNRVLSDLQAAA